MRPEHIARIANAVRDHIWSSLEVCAPGGPWRTVRGDVIRGGEEQRVEGFVAGFELETEVLHLDPLDWAPAVPAWPRPEPQAWVRFKDPAGQTVVRRIAVPFRIRPGGRFMVAALKAADALDLVP